MMSPFRIDRRATLACASLVLVVLVSGCATTTPDSKLSAVYCINAPGANPGTAPSSVPEAYCTNLQAGAAPAAAPAATSAALGTAAGSAAAVGASGATTLAATAPKAAVAVPLAAATPATAATATTAGAANNYVAPHGALTLAPNVNLDRYMGRWYVIGFIPYAFENGRVGAYYDYKKDGSDIDFLYKSRRHDFDHDLETRKGQAYVLKNTHNAKWRVTFTWPIYNSYLILYVDPAYKVALVGYPGRSLGWVLSRSPQMDDATYQSLLARFAAHGYDISQFRRVPQTPEQINTVN